MSTLYKGKYLELLEDGGWEYVRRRGTTGVVVILPLTDDNKVVLVEQYRKPVQSRVLELPAGLSGDIIGAEDEPLVAAAKRELLEETGYTANSWEDLGEAPVSAGLTNETVQFFVARGLTKIEAGGGDDSEDITVLEVPLATLRSTLKSYAAKGSLIDAKIGGALWLAGC